MDGTSRRRLLILAGVPALAIVAGRFADLAGIGAAAGRAAEAALRPSSIGSSATRCASCGSTGHSMLSADCPAGPHVRTGARA